MPGNLGRVCRFYPKCEQGHLDVGLLERSVGVLCGACREDTKISGRVLQLTARDSLQFNGYGCGTPAAVARLLTETANDEIFADQCCERVAFMNTDLAIMEDVSITV